jgi:hypothetical protein
MDENYYGKVHKMSDIITKKKQIISDARNEVYYQVKKLLQRETFSN